MKPLITNLVGHGHHHRRKCVPVQGSRRGSPSRWPQRLDHPGPASSTVGIALAFPAGTAAWRPCCNPTILWWRPGKLDQRPAMGSWVAGQPSTAAPSSLEREDHLLSNGVGPPQMGDPKSVAKQGRP